MIKDWWIGEEKPGNCAVSCYWCYRWGLTAELMGTSFSFAHEASYPLSGLGRKQEARTGCCLFSRLGFLHAVKNIDWNGWKLIVYLGLTGPPMEKKVVLALPVTWHEENRDTFIPRNLSVLVTENEELWFQSHSQGRIQSKWLSSCSLSPYFQGCVSKCWLSLVESKGSSHVPLPQYCPCLCKSRWVLVARCKNIRMEEK